MKKIFNLLLVTLCFSLFVNSGCNNSSPFDECVSELMSQMSSEERPMEFEQFNIPSNEDIVDCLCEKLTNDDPDGYKKWIEMDSSAVFSEEGQERLEWTIECMGFDSMEDYFRQMMQLSLDTLSVELDTLSE